MPAIALMLGKRRDALERLADPARMRSRRQLAGVFAVLSIFLGAGAFACVMSHVGGSRSFVGFPTSAIAAATGFVALGAPR
jgi:hypothetical protein